MKLRSALLVLLLASSAHALTLKTGSWVDEYPAGSHGVPVPNGQNITLTGNRGFRFSGVITDFWRNVGECPPTGCTSDAVNLNWYTGTGRCIPATHVCNHRGIGATGMVTWSGHTYKTGLSGPALRFYVYGMMAKPDPAPDGTHVTKTKKLPLIGVFEHSGVNTPLSGETWVTVEFERDGDEWEVEDIEYDLEVESD